LTACGGNTTTPTPTGPQQYDQTQKPVSPKGTIYGRVVDIATQNPLEGVSVKVLGSDAALTTSADGTFKLDNVAVSSTYTFIFEKQGYLRTRQTAAIPGSAGNSPLEGGITSFSLEMYPSTGTVTGFVFLPNGRPAPNATVYVDQRSFGESVVTTQTGADGAFSLAGLATRPSGVSHTVYAQWYDENGDMQADYSTTNSFVTVFPGQAARTFINYSNVQLRLVASNIVDGEIPAGEDLQFTFSVPLFTGTLQGSTARPWVLTNTTLGSIDVPAEGTFMSPTVLRVKPALNSLQEGQSYRITLALRAASLSQGTGIDFNQSFDFQVRAAAVMPYTTQVTGLAVTNPNPVAPYPETAFDYAQNQFYVSFTPAAGAVRYEIYARDTANIPNFTRVQVFTADGSPRYQRTVSLGSPFTNNFSGGLLAAGNRVTFAVVGVDAYGARAPLMSAPTVEVRDTIPPRVTSGPNLVPPLNVNTVDAINDGTTASTIQLRINYSEPMDPASMVTYTSNATNAPMAAFRWDPANTSSGILTLTIGAGNDATGSFVIRGGKDGSGNDLQQAGDLVGFLGGRRELLQTPDFQNGTMCGLGTSWVASTLNGGPTPTTINNNGSVTGNVSPCAAVLGSVPGGMPGTGRSRILQGITLPSLMNTGFRLEANARYRLVNVPNSAISAVPAYTMRCFFADTNDAPFAIPLNLFGSTPAIPTVSPSYTTAGPLNISAQAGNQVRLICEVENTNMMAPGFGAMYLDEMSVALVKPTTL
ncbi:MAG: carboxypeptidase regulatory-like domain-containing protein, partial [Archangium sp.]|nr:carboxypeptidase regulatory-like domain-containing protein [Archangium sp.]